MARYADSPRLAGANCRRLLASGGIRRSRLARKGGVAEPGCHKCLTVSSPRVFTEAVVSSGRVEKSPHEQEIKFFAKVSPSLVKCSS